MGRGRLIPMARADVSTSGDTRLRVLVVDHRRAFSEALAERLAQESDVAVAVVVESLEAAEGALDEVGATVGTVAIDLQNGSGLVLITRARQSHPAVRWVVVGTDGRPLEVADALVAGASGYVTMSSSFAVLAGALRSAVAGFSVTPEELLRRAIVELDTPTGSCLNPRCPGVAGVDWDRSLRLRRMPSVACSSVTGGGRGWGRGLDDHGPGNR